MDPPHGEDFEACLELCRRRRRAGKIKSGAASTSNAADMYDAFLFQQPFEATVRCLMRALMTVSRDGVAAACKVLYANEQQGLESTISLPPSVGNRYTRLAATCESLGVLRDLMVSASEETIDDFFDVDKAGAVSAFACMLSLWADALAYAAAMEASGGRFPMLAHAQSAGELLVVFHSHYQRCLPRAASAVRDIMQDSGVLESFAELACEDGAWPAQARDQLVRKALLEMLASMYPDVASARPATVLADAALMWLRACRGDGEREKIVGIVQAIVSSTRKHMHRAYKPNVDARDVAAAATRLAKLLALLAERERFHMLYEPASVRLPAAAWYALSVMLGGLAAQAEALARAGAVDRRLLQAVAQACSANLPLLASSTAADELGRIRINCEVAATHAAALALALRKETLAPLDIFQHILRRAPGQTEAAEASALASLEREVLAQRERLDALINERLQIEELLAQMEHERAEAAGKLQAAQDDCARHEKEIERKEREAAQALLRVQQADEALQVRINQRKRALDRNAKIEEETKALNRQLQELQAERKALEAAAKDCSERVDGLRAAVARSAAHAGTQTLAHAGTHAATQANAATQARPRDTAARRNAQTQTRKSPSDELGGLLADRRELQHVMGSLYLQARMAEACMRTTWEKVGKISDALNIDLNDLEACRNPREGR